MVKNALSWRSHFWSILEPIFGDFFCSFFKFIVDLILDYCLNLFESHFGSMVDENRPKREANDSKQPSKASKTPKAAFSKKHKKKTKVFHYFWQQRPLKNVSRGPRCPQWFTHRNPNHKRKKPKIKAIDFQIFNKTKQTNLDTKATNKKNQKMTPFLRPPSPASQGSK